MDTGRRQAKVGSVDSFPRDKSYSQDQNVRGPLMDILYIYIFWFEGKEREESTGKGPGVKTAFEARSESSEVGDRRTAGATPALICGRPCAGDSLSLFIAAGY